MTIFRAAGGVNSQVEQSDVAESVMIATVNEPVIRQTKLQNTAQLMGMAAIVAGVYLVTKSKMQMPKKEVLSEMEATG